MSLKESFKKDLQKLEKINFDMENIIKELSNLKEENHLKVDSMQDHLEKEIYQLKVENSEIKEKNLYYRAVFLDLLSNIDDILSQINEIENE